MHLAGPPQAIPDDERSGAAARFGIGLAGFCAFLGVYATQPLLPTLERLFGVGKATAALTVSAPTIAVAVASPFAGLLAARLGHRRVIVAALFTLAVPTLLAATARSIAALVAWRFAQGLAVPFAYAVAVAFITEEWPAHGLGRAMSALIAGNVVGGFAGRVLSGAAVQWGGWRASFVVLGLLTAACACAAARALPRGGSPRIPAREAPPFRLGLLAREPRLLATFAVGFNVLFTLIATFTYVTFHLAAPPFLLGANALSWIFVVYLAGALVMPFAGRWIDRVGSRRAISTALAGSVLGGALTLAPSLWFVELGLAAICTAVFVSQAASTSFLRIAAPPEARSAASGVYVSFYYLGGAVGGVLPAAVWRVGGWPACVALVAAVQLVTLAIAWRFWRPVEASEPETAAEVALPA
jgi:predicted MFS family arabinose efflux permease